MARANRFLSGSKLKTELYPDWEQAVDRKKNKLEQLILPAASFISIDRVNEAGDIKQGNRQVIGRFAPRGQPKPQLLTPARVDTTRQLVQAFGDLDLLLVNVQNVRGRNLASSIEYFLRETSGDVPMLIIAASPADLIAVRALEPPSKPLVIIGSIPGAPKPQVTAVNRDRPIADRQFCFAIDGISEKSDLLNRLVSQAERTWWAVRQSMSLDVPREAAAFENLYSDLLSRNLGGELELLQEARRLIQQEGDNGAIRDERRNAVIRAAMHDTKAQNLLVVVRSESAAEELKFVFAGYLEVDITDLPELGIDIMSVFGPWPSRPYDACVAAGYFGTSTIDMLFSCGAQKAIFVVDPIEARIALWDIEKRFCVVPGLPKEITDTFHSFSSALEDCASPSAAPIWLSMLLGGGKRFGSPTPIAPSYSSRANYVCLCFSDGSTRQTTANARFEVLGRKRLQLQSVPAKELQTGDQIILLNDDERAAFSERLLRVMDEGRLRSDSQARSMWITTLRAVKPVSVSEIRRRMNSESITIDQATIRTWLPPDSSEDCGVPERENVFLAFARSLDISIPAEILGDWFAGINRLRINHRRIGRELVRAIRGAYLDRLDPITIAKMQHEWGVEAKLLLEAARVAIVDDVIPLTQ